MRELEQNTAAAWIESGAIRVTEYGNENTYYVNEFGHEFFCKNYPNDLYGVVNANVVFDNYDPTPWCHICGAMDQSNCNCGPYADNR